MKFSRSIALAFLLSSTLIISACGTNPTVQTAFYEAEKAKAEAWRDVMKAKYAAQALIAASAANASSTGDAGAKAAAAVSIAANIQGANSGNSGNSEAMPTTATPESGEKVAYRWTSMLLGIGLPSYERIQGSRYNYLANMHTSDNQTAQVESTNGAFVSIVKEAKPNYNNSFNAVP